MLAEGAGPLTGAPGFQLKGFLQGGGSWVVHLRAGGSPFHLNDFKTFYKGRYRPFTYAGGSRFQSKAFRPWSEGLEGVGPFIGFQ